MGVYASLNSFNAGELSPKMLGRVDVSQYGKGCRTLRNFFVTPYGAAERRPGTRFIAQAKNSNRNVRLVRFVFSSTIAYVCEFGHQYIRFFLNGAPVMSGNTVFEVETTYTEDDLADLKFIQSADVMTLVHPDHPVMELKRTAETTFELAEKDFEYPPVLDPNLDDTHTITPSDVTGDITLTANEDTFTSGNVGGYFQLVHTRQENEISKDFTADGTSDALEVKGNWTFTTHGTWTGTITIQRSFDNGATWNDYRTYSSANDSNVSTSGEEEEDGVLYQLEMSDYQQSGTGTLKKCRCLFVNPDFVTHGVVKITSYTDAQHVGGTVVRKLGGTDATHEWNEGAWSARRGYPRTVAYYEERMMFGGTAYRPQTVWGSKTGDWDNFLLGDKDDDGLDFTLSSDTVNTICWMCQHDALIIGTADSEWTLSASDRQAALTPSNFRVRRQSVYGASGIAASMVGDTVLFVQRGGRKVREFVYNWEKDGYVSPDMTILADHITESGVIDSALQQQPDTILWCVLGDGTAAALTYERDQEVVGWHKHTTQGQFISVCVIPNGAQDKVYFAVRRAGIVTIEEMAARDAWIYADCAVDASGSGITEVSGLGHLEGMTVQVLADNAVQRSKVVDGGKIALDSPADHVVAGLGYDSILSPMPIEIEMRNGMSLLRKKAVGELRIRTYGSVGGEVRAGQDVFQSIISRDVIEDDMDNAVTAKDDVVTFNTNSGYDTATTIEIIQREPLPLNVTSIVAVFEVME